MWAGQFENFTRAKDRLLIVVPVALAIIFGMLFLMFGEMRTVACVFACVPLGLIGGIVALNLRGLPFSIPAAVGFIALCGVAVLNGVVMASELHRRLADWDENGNPFVESAAAVLRPVITTALVAAIGFIPMALSTRAGAEVQRPLATVVIGGILSSTLLSLFVLPTLLKLLVKRAAPTSDSSCSVGAERDVVDADGAAAGVRERERDARVVVVLDGMNVCVNVCRPLLRLSSPSKSAVYGCTASPTLVCKVPTPDAWNENRYEVPPDSTSGVPAGDAHPTSAAPGLLTQ